MGINVTGANTIGALATVEAGIAELTAQRKEARRHAEEVQAGEARQEAHDAARRSLGLAWRGE
jgi:hypothetical protein